MTRVPVDPTVLVRVPSSRGDGRGTTGGFARAFDDVMTASRRDLANERDVAASAAPDQPGGNPLEPSVPRSQSRDAATADSNAAARLSALLRPDHPGPGHGQPALSTSVTREPHIREKVETRTGAVRVAQTIAQPGGDHQAEPAVGEAPSIGLPAELTDRLSDEPLPPHRLSHHPLATQQLSDQPLSSQLQSVQPLSTQLQSDQPPPTQLRSDQPPPTQRQSDQPLFTQPQSGQPPSTQRQSDQPQSTQRQSDQKLRTQPLIAQDRDKPRPPGLLTERGLRHPVPVETERGESTLPAELRPPSVDPSVVVAPQIAPSLHAVPEALPPLSKPAANVRLSELAGNSAPEARTSTGRATAVRGVDPSEILLSSADQNENVDPPRSEFRHFRPVAIASIGLPRNDAPPEVTRRETHFAPVLRLPTMLPVSEALAVPLRPEVSLETLGYPGPTSAASSLARPAFAQLEQALDTLLSPVDSTKAVENVTAPKAAGSMVPVRIIELQLHPAALGTLTVTMRLSSAGLKVSVMASVRETAERLSEDRDELAALVRRAGYDDAEISIDASSARSAGDGDADAGGASHGDRRDRSDRPPGAKNTSIESNAGSVTRGKALIV